MISNRVEVIILFKHTFIFSLEENMKNVQHHYLKDIFSRKQFLIFNTKNSGSGWKPEKVSSRYGESKRCPVELFPDISVCPPKSAQVAIRLPSTGYATSFKLSATNQDKEICEINLEQTIPLLCLMEGFSQMRR